MRIKWRYTQLLFLLVIFHVPFSKSQIPDDDTPSFVEEIQEPQEAQGDDSLIAPVSGALQMILALLCIVALAYLVLNKGFGAFLKRQQNGGTIRVKERIPLDGKNALFLVEVESRLMVLAASEKGVDVIIPSLSPEASELAQQKSSSFSTIYKNSQAGA